MNNVLTNRHDILVILEVSNGNPNGDPDAGNMPRIEPNTNKGFITDVCLKRKIRNYIEMFAPERKSLDDNGFDILIKQGAVIEEKIDEAENVAKIKARFSKERKKMSGLKTGCAVSFMMFALLVEYCQPARAS